jgi:hypothetical protein
MAKGKKAPVAAPPTTPEPTPDTAPPSSPGSEPEPPITKTEAIRRAMAAGKDVPSSGVPWIRDTFGIKVSDQMFSTVKSQINGGGKGKKKAKPTPTVPTPTPATKPKTVAVASVELAKQIKFLVRMYGADAVLDMAALFAD